MENIAIKIEEHLSNMSNSLTRLEQQLSQSNACRNCKDYDKTKYFMAEIFVKNYNHITSFKDRRRLIRQDALVPRDLFKIIPRPISIVEMTDYLYKHYPNVLSYDTTPDKIQKMYHDETKENFNHDKFREYIRSLDKNKKYFQDLNAYKVITIKIQSNGNYPTFEKRWEIHLGSPYQLQIIDELISCGESIKLTINLTSVTDC